MTCRIGSLLLFILVPCLCHAQKPDEPFHGLKFRSIGPSIGGRVSRACGVAGDPFTFYAATAGGGVWKSSDAGFTWKPIFEDQPVASIGSIAVAPSDSNVIYVGTGEANIRGNVAPGNGIYRSTDAGKTWTNVWKNVGQIGTMIVHPGNSEVAFAAVLGNPFAPSDQRGVYRTRDGGQTWQRVLYQDPDTGCSDICFDSGNPRILFAGMWQTRRRPWELTSGGPGSGLHVSRDGGDTWKRLGPVATETPPGSGLPKGPWGKVCVATAPSNFQRVYAMIEAADGGLYRSDDGGEKWERANDARALRQRAWYFSTITVDPSNADIVYFPQVPMLKSVDGGKSLQRVSGFRHGDHHDLWIDPNNPLRMIDSNDGGVEITVNGGKTWYAPQLPIGQFYHIACDHRTPYRVGGCLQDIGAYSGPSHSLTAGILLADWEPIGGGEAGHVAFDPADPDIVYAGEYGGYISRFDRRTRQARHVGVYPYNPSGHGGADLKFRFQWTAPIAVSPHAPHAVYHGGNALFRSLDGGQTWQRISGDLTRNDRNKQQWSGGPITGDNTGVEIFCTLFAVAESPKQKGVIWTGSDDGLVHVSRDDGKNWVNVTPQIPDLPDWGTVCCVEPSPFDAGTAYVVVRAYRLGDFRPHLWRTTDFGKTWVRLTAKLPSDEYLHVVRSDPKRKGLLYAGSEHGLWLSHDDGANWRRLKLNLPTVAVHDIVVKNDDLVLGTMGRSAWILDDLTPIRDWLPGKRTTLFTPPVATRWRLSHNPAAEFANLPGDNPPPGAMITYRLADKPKKPITLEIVDAGGKRVAILESKPEEKPEETADVGSYSAGKEKKKPLPAEAGLHRIAWDMKHMGAKKIPGAVVDAGNPEDGPLALPGKYTLKLSVDGQTLSAPLTILPDPRVKSVRFTVGKSELSAEAALKQQHEFVLQLRDDLTAIATSVAQIRSIKKQLLDRAELLKNETSAKPLLDANKKLVTKLDALEEKLHNPRAKTVYDILAQKGGAKLLSQLTGLYSFALDGDGPPTQGMKEVYSDLAKELKQLLDQWQSLLASDVAAYQSQSKKLDFPGLVIPKPAP